MVKVMRSKIDMTAYILIAIFVLFLIIFGWKVHIIETNGAEMDAYADKADEILTGKIPRDAYHPLLYPILSAGIGVLVKDGFTGARIVSSLSAGLFLLAAYLLGRSCFGRAVSLFSLVALVINYNVITAGLEAATDMSFAALALLTLLFSIRISSGLSHSSLVMLALSFALAYFTRYSALFLVPTIVIAFAFSLSQVKARQKTLALAAFAGAVLFFLIPHFILTIRVFSSPFYNENWKNLAFKMYGGGDWTYFHRIPYDGLFSVLVSSPSKLFFFFIRELARFFYITVSALGGQGLAGGLFAACALLGVYNSLFALDRKRIILISFAGFCVIISCAFSYSLPRFMLPILPLCYLWGGSFILSGPWAGFFQIAKLRMIRAAPVIAVFMLALFVSTVLHLRMYVDAHPVRELEAACFIEQKYGSNVTVLGTFPYMQRYVKYSYHQLEDAYGEERIRPDLYVNRLKTVVAAARADYVIIGKLFLQNRPVGLLDLEHVPDFLDPILQNSDVVVYQVRKIEGGLE